MISGIGRPLGNSDKNAFLWNYVVKGKTNTTFDKGEYQEQVVGNERKEVIDEKVLLLFYLLGEI